jgi:putative transposase
VSEFNLDGRRLPEGAAKADILRAIESARPWLALALVLRVLRLQPARYHAWRHSSAACALDDHPSCSRTSPGQLTVAEVATVKTMFLAPEHRHMPLRTLALFAQRVGKVFVSVTTWAKLVREHGWRRPRHRLHPPKPTVGIRAAQPNETWHVDTTVIRLLDGTRAYIHATIDNFSRKILAWTVAARLEPTSTAETDDFANVEVCSDDTPETAAAFIRATLHVLSESRIRLRIRCAGTAGATAATFIADEEPSMESPRQNWLLAS